jgi:hypothetical protein
MPTIEQVKALLPNYQGLYALINYRQSTDEIIDYIAVNHERYKDDYDAISYLFDTGDVYSTCKGLWDFLKWNIPYQIETDKEQTVKSPAAILDRAEKVDCKNYSLFIGGVLDSINREYNDTWTWVYRYAGYQDSKNIGHVFVVVFDGNKEIWIDPVLRSFDEHKKPLLIIDQDVMALYSVSGVGDANVMTIQVDKTKAEQSFLYMLNKDNFALKQLFDNNPDIVYGAMQDYFLNNGFDFNHFLAIWKA